MSPAADPRPEAVLEFWFAPESRERWFRSTPQFDAAVRDRLLGLWHMAREGHLDHWEEGADGALALAILLDQVPLNVFRGRPEAFSTEQGAREVADRAIGRGLDRELSREQKVFLYMPFMHSEHLVDQDRALALFEAAGLEGNARWARHHRDIVARFGRFPHRNAALGRATTPEEAAWLARPEAFKG
ncbi:MAG: DUF924 family protein [Chromatiales bacterium]|jgi:uncharacterized protein (DUF924 family)